MVVTMGVYNEVLCIAGVKVLPSETKFGEFAGIKDPRDMVDNKGKTDDIVMVIELPVDIKIDVIMAVGTAQSMTLY
jgi:hypothetical protein